MADERGNVENTGGDVDPLGESQGTESQGTDDTSQVQSQTAIDSASNDPGSSGVKFGDLPFKTTDEMVKGHKSLQEAYRTSRTDLFQLQEQMRQLQPLIEKLKALEAREGVVDETTDVPAFLETFIKGPDKAIDGRADKRIEARLKDFEAKSLSPLQAELAKLRNEREIDKFMGDHKELSSDDEDALLDVFRETPWLRNMQGSVYDRLDAAYSLLLRKEPTRFTSRGDDERNKAKGDLNSMKKSASSIGAKSGTRATAAKDEFDGVLEEDAAQRALWRR